MTTNVDKLEVRRLTGVIGAEIGGVDLAEQLGDAAVACVRELLLEHQVLVFRDQPISPGQLKAFAEVIGEVIPGLIETEGSEVPGVMRLEATAPGGYSRMWHTDHTFMEEPPMAAILQAVELPSAGGDTCWASMYAAYEALSPALRQMLDALTAIHSTQALNRVIATDTRLTRNDTVGTEAVHPVVRVHPDTGRKALFVVYPKTTRIVELSERESEAVLGFLFVHLQAPEFQCRVRWEPGTVVLWDERSTQHCAVADYDENRMMYRTMLRGDRPFGPSAADSRRVLQA